MGTQAVSCNNCGAPLEVGEQTRYATCAFCGSQLGIHRSGNAVYSEVLERISRDTADIADDVEVIRLQNELERLDREWLLEREQHMMRGKHGRTYRPSRAGGVVAAVVMGGFGVLWTGLAVSMGAPFFFPLFGLVFIGFAVFVCISSVTKAGAYARGEQTYQARRDEVLRRLASRRQGG
jgi:hypothetical protein